MIVDEIPWLDPLAIAPAFYGAPGAHLLHSAATMPAGWGGGEWSIFVAEPASVFQVRDGCVEIDGQSQDNNPFEVFAEFLKSRENQAADTAKALGRQDPFFKTAPFLSGCVGYIGYEMGTALEPSVTMPPSPYRLPDMVFGAYDSALLFHKRMKRAFIVARNDAATTPLRRALQMLSQINAHHCSIKPYNVGDWSSNFTAPQYRAAIAGVVENILDGDFFQANIAQQIKFEIEHCNASDLFAVLSNKSAAPYGAFLQYEEGAIFSNSPERFFTLKEGRKIICEPIKGTRPRSDNENEDRHYAVELLKDEKDRAENIMIVDLMRNDLSRVCIDNSIDVEKICALVSYATVHHLVSTVSGALKDDFGVSDVLAALFPCGSITGAPKVEAMKAIARTEKIGRGPYCGAIGYIDDRGYADFSVAIRTMMMTPTKKGVAAVIPVGGGITHQSNPAREYQETLDKAAFFLGALGAKEAAL